MPLPPQAAKISDIGEHYWAKNETHDAHHHAFRERQMTGRTYELHGLRLTCPAGIYQPDEISSTRFILRELLLCAHLYGPRALDMGTGSGAIALALAKSGKVVTATDIDPEAVLCAQANAEDNDLSIDVRCSDLFSAVNGERFDLIVFNAPLRHDKVEHPVDRVACDPDGELTLRFLREAPAHLTAGGSIVLLAASSGRREALMEGLSAFDHRVIAAEYSSTLSSFRWLLVAQPR